MDIEYTYRDSKGDFSLRSAALIIQNNQILLVKSDKYDCFYTVGGGMRENETSDNAAIRECYEETGYRLETERLVFVQERFFEVDNTRHHEIAFFYLMRSSDITICNGSNTDHDNEHLYWVDIESLKDIDLVPKFLKTALKNMPDEIKHIVSYD